MKNRITILNTGFAPLLGLTFIILQLTGVINWSWWWVLAPFWIPIALGILIFIIALVVVAASDINNERL